MPFRRNANEKRRVRKAEARQAIACVGRFEMRLKTATPTIKKLASASRLEKESITVV
jgi:hypothetical protein